MIIERNYSKTIIFSLLWILSTVFLLIVPSQSDFTSISLGYIGALIAYAYFIASKGTFTKFYWILGLGLFVRLVAVIIFPQLSDDIYRFVWDGRIAQMGYQPYAYLPTDIVKELPALDRDGILSVMNSPDYFTVYPPVSQLIFYLSSFLGWSMVTSSIVMKSFFLVAECVTLIYGIKLLKELKLSSSLILIYWLHPLIILEGIGNLHFEIIMIAFLSLAFYMWKIGKVYRAMIFLALSVGSKLLSLLVLPYMIWKLCNRDKIKALGVFGIAMLLVFSPLLLGLNYIEFLSSIDLYFRKFEFNASIYYVLRGVGYLFQDYNLIAFIGPLLGLTFLIYGAYYTLRNKAENAPQYLYRLLFMYLLLATTVHPWYLSMLIFCTVFIQDRTALIWSAVIWLSYINYSYEVYYENLYIVVLEYSLVLLGWFYCRKRKTLNITSNMS